MSTPARVRIRIGTLSVSGLGALSRSQLHEAVVAELSRRLVHDHATPHAASVRTADGGSFPLRAGMGADAIGSAIAARVHGSIAP